MDAASADGVVRFWAWLYNHLLACGIQNIDMAQKLDVSKMRVATPCRVGWDSMIGDDRARFCGSCDRHVYNIVGLSRGEIESLVENTEGRLCVRMYQRADETVLTQDCPVGLRLIRKRIATFAGAALSALLGLVSIGYGQQSVEYCTSTEFERVKIDSKDGRISGIVKDPSSAVVPGIIIALSSKGSLTATAISNDKGEFSFGDVGRSKKRYVLTIQRQDGWATKVIKKITLNPGENLVYSICLIPVVPEVIGDFAGPDAH